MNLETIDFLIIDWGTTNFRAFGMDSAGTLVDKIERNLGLLQVRDAQFSRTLETVLSDWLPQYQQLPIFMAGMVGSAQGWKNTPYVATPVNQKALIAAASALTLPWGVEAYIIPGVSHLHQEGYHDVMRGEEVQLFGLASLTGQSAYNAVFPGTHSKHIRYEDDKIEHFATFMTGELFSVISKHTILGLNLPEQVCDQASFLKGVKESTTTDLTHKLFSARTHRLFGSIAEPHIYDYLSGLLIGTELKALNAPQVYLVGGHSLCERYTCACELLNIQSITFNGDDCFLAGMLELKKAIDHA